MGMSERFIPLNYLNSPYYGVYDVDKSAWVIEPEWTWRKAESMANALNVNPKIETDQLYLIGAAG
jgi:hypothetical protein